MKEKKHVLSHRNLVNLTDLAMRQISFYLGRLFFVFLSLQEAMFPLQKGSEVLRVVANLHGREKYLKALREKVTKLKKQGGIHAAKKQIQG